MIATHTYSDMGCPGEWVLMGIYAVEIEPVGPNGYGVSTTTLYKMVTDKFLEEHPGKLLLNARFEITMGSGHPSYGCRRIRMTGDIFQPRVYGLKEIPAQQGQAPC